MKQESQDHASKQQPYDSSIKALFKKDAPELIPQFLPEAIFTNILDMEVLRAPQRADRVYEIFYRDKPHILHLEFQSTHDKQMAKRLLLYHADIWQDHDKPVISMVIYLFKAKTPAPPLRELSGTDEILTFHYRVLEMWNFDARHYLQQHLVSMYTLLPTMNHADAAVLLQAHAELVEYYQKDATDLKDRHLWFQTFLQRTTTVSEQEKQKVRKRLDVFDQLLEENDFVIKQKAISKEQGKAEGEVEASQHILLTILQTRFPELFAQMSERVLKTKQVQKLYEAVQLVVNASDQQKAQLGLDTLLP
jgi:hypothetical protein